MLFAVDIHLYNPVTAVTYHKLIFSNSVHMLYDHIEPHSKCIRRTAAVTKRSLSKSRRIGEIWKDME